MAKKVALKKPTKTGKKTIEKKTVKVVAKPKPVAKPIKKKVGATFITPKPTKRSEGVVAEAPSRKPVTEVAFSSIKEDTRNDVAKAASLVESTNAPIVEKPSNVTFVGHSTIVHSKPSPVQNNEAKIVLTELSQKVYYICNDSRLPVAWQVVDKIKQINPNVLVEVRHPSADSKRQSKFIISYMGESIDCPADGYYTTNV